MGQGWLRRVMGTDNGVQSSATPSVRAAEAAA